MLKRWWRESVTDCQLPKHAEAPRIHQNPASLLVLYIGETVTLCIRMCLHPGAIQTFSVTHCSEALAEPNRQPPDFAGESPKWNREGLPFFTLLRDEFKCSTTTTTTILQDVEKSC